MIGEVLWMEPECRTRHRILSRPAPHIRACCGRLSFGCDPRKLQKKSYDAVSAANPFAIDPAKITVEPGVSYLPSPIKLDGHAAGVVANAMKGDLQRQRDIIRSEFGPACGWVVKGVHYD
jgi:hypothetical protein